MNNFNRLLVSVGLLGMVAMVPGCSPNNSQPEMHVGNTNATTATTSSSAPVSAVTGMPSLAPPAGVTGSPASVNTPDQPMGMMTQDPRSITEVEGKIVEVQPDQILLQKGSVTLRFHVSPTTVVKPDGKKLAADQTVKIHIEQVADGMSAKEIDIQ